MRQAARAIACLSLFLLWIAVSSAHAAPRVTITPVGEAQTVFDWSRDACETWDVPDAPARAFRDAEGNVHLIASHFVNRAAVGPSLDALKHDCDVIFRGGNQDAPEKFDDRAWLSGLFTEDGRTVYALVHNEFQGNHRPALCPSRTYMRCWRNAITFAVSRDGGRSFVQPEPPGQLVATPPHVYEGDYGRHVGYFNPTNIVKKDGFYYAMFSAAEYHEQKWGNCLMRTDRLADPSSWRAWNGKGFTIRFVNPYTGGGKDPAREVCAPVGLGRLITPLGGIVRHEPSGLYVVVMAGQYRRLSGIYAAVSRDLIDWSEPSLVWQGPATVTPGECPTVKYDYPSLIDSASDDRNFATVGTTADLYIAIQHQESCRAGPNRDLLRRSVRIEVVE